MIGVKMVGFITSVIAFAAPALSQADTSRFAVASVKVFKDDGISPRNSHATYNPDGINFGALTLAFIIGEAYQFPPGRMQGPGSLTKENLWAPLRQGYDIVAKVDRPAPKAELRAMLQSLLAERFHLELHRESNASPSIDGPRRHSQNR